MTHVRSGKKRKHHHKESVSSTGATGAGRLAARPVSTERSPFYSAGPLHSLGSPLQTKLVVGPADDNYEQEADTVANRVVAGQPAPPISTIGRAGSGPSLQTQMVDEEEREEEGSVQARLQRQAASPAAGQEGPVEEEEQPVQARLQRQSPMPAAEEEVLPAEQEEPIEEEEEGRMQRCGCRGFCQCHTRGEEGAQQPGVIRRQPEDEEAESNFVQAKVSFPTVPDAEKEAPEEGAESETEEQEKEEPGASPEGEAAKEAKGKEEEGKVTLPAIEPPAMEEETPPIQTRSLPGSNRHQNGRSPAQGQKGSSLSDTLRKSKGRGHSLPVGVRSEMEQRFDKDFSDVRVHTSSDSIQMNRNLGARAFTHEQNIYFNAGEYAPTSRSGKSLLAHELTHTVQQGAANDRIQRRVGAPEPTPPDPDTERPKDGEEVEGRMEEKVEDDPRVKERDELSEEEREEARNPDRSEVRQESRDISSSGEAAPSEDRGAKAKDKTEKQKKEIEQKVEEQSPETGKKEEGEGKEEKTELSEAEVAAQRAQAAEKKAQAVVIPDEPEPFKHPRIEAPVDSADEPLPRNSQIDTQVRGLSYIGEMLREKGYEMKRHAAEKKIASHGLDAVREKEREDLARAEEGTAMMQSHNESRREVAENSRKAHEESVKRQQFVAEKAPRLAEKAAEGEEKSGALASEASSKAGRSERKIPDDPDAREDAKEQSGEMQSAAEGAQLMDRAIRQTEKRARQYEQDAADATKQNEKSEAEITEAEDVIAQTEARVTEMQVINEASQAQIENTAAGPALIRQHAQQNDRSGDQVIAATIVMEEELNALQDQYLDEMSQIESREEAEKRLQEEQEREAPEQALSSEDRQLFELAGMSEAEQEQRVAEMEQSQRDSLLARLEQMIQEAPDEGTAESEGARLSVNTGLSQSIMGEQPADPRAEQIQEVENRRIQRVGGVLDIADQNMGLLTAAQQAMLAERLVAQSIADDIKNINVLQMGKDMLIGMVDPRQSLASVFDGIDKIATGVANIGNWEAWQRDPLGNLLQVAADITTGLAMVFSAILGIATIITAIMAALIIITWGFAAVTASPVIAWMGTLITYAGWGAIIAGALAVYFNYLSYIKNLHDAGTAETARELFGNTEQMKQNATDGFQGAMAVVEGVGAVKMGPALRSGAFWDNFPRSPGQWARQTVEGVRESASSLAAAPARIARGARRLFAGGRQGLVRFKQRLHRMFSRRRPGDQIDVDLETPQAARRHDNLLDEARGKRVRDMDDAEFRAEMREVADNRPRRIDPGSEHFAEYDIEIEANGHTYRRRRDGRAWCRFSPGPEECTISPEDLPEPARQAVRDFERGHSLQDEFEDPDIADLDPESRRILEEADQFARERGVDLEFDPDELVGFTRVTEDGRIINRHLAGQRHPRTNVPFNEDGFPIFDSLHDTPDMPPRLRGPSVSDETQMRWATRNLREELNRNPGRRANFTDEQLAAIDAGEPRIPEYTWHHHEDGRTLQLVDRDIHDRTGHSGGRQLTGGRS